jgi:hypothetical protein
MAEIPESSGPNHQNLQNLPEAALRGGFDGFVGWLSLQNLPEAALRGGFDGFVGWLSGWSGR